MVSIGENVRRWSEARARSRSARPFQLGITTETVGTAGTLDRVMSRAQTSSAKVAPAEHDGP